MNKSSLNIQHPKLAQRWTFTLFKTLYYGYANALLKQHIHSY